jgi:hypothetical protein
MRNIANGSLDGLPEGLRTVYVESNPASHLATPVVDFVCDDASLPSGTARQAVIDMLTEVRPSPPLLLPLSLLPHPPSPFLHRWASRRSCRPRPCARSRVGGA